VIVVDTSALVAIALGEPNGAACEQVIAGEPHALISAGTVAEALIVAERLKFQPEMIRLIDGLGLEIVPVTPEAARRIGEAYARWGKGAHPAGLNFGDCFAYELAMVRACPLLFVGRDFARTDVDRAL
jgi:ribonuclease VapC